MKIDPLTGMADMNNPGESTAAAAHNAAQVMTLLSAAPTVFSRSDIERESRALEWKLRLLIQEHGVQSLMRALGNAIAALPEQ